MLRYCGSAGQKLKGKNGMSLELGLRLVRFFLSFRAGDVDLCGARAQESKPAQTAPRR